MLSIKEERVKLNEDLGIVGGGEIRRNRGTQPQSCFYEWERLVL